MRIFLLLFCPCEFTYATNNKAVFKQTIILSSEFYCSRSLDHLLYIAIYRNFTNVKMCVSRETIHFYEYSFCGGFLPLFVHEYHPPDSLFVWCCVVIKQDAHKNGHKLSHRGCLEAGRCRDALEAQMYWIVPKTPSKYGTRRACCDINENGLLD